MSTLLRGNWSFPTTIWAGPGRIADLPKAIEQAAIRRPLLVTDEGLAHAPIFSRARALLGNAATFTGIAGNPGGAHVAAGLQAFKSNDCDGVIAMGGGSALDVGKLIAFMTGQSRPLWDFEDIGDWWTRADPSGIASVVAIPTTAGTGSEVGRAGVVVREDTHQKKIIFHPKMMPRVVILDAELTVGLPPAITAATGMDALTHCFEAFCAPGFHPLADGVALEGLRLVDRFLPRAYANGTDIEARANMLAAAAMGATAFQKGLGAVHAIAHPVGSWFNTHHGLTNAILLPYVVAFNREAILDKTEVISRALNLPKRGYEGVYEWLLRLRASLGIPNSLAQIGVDTRNAQVIGQEAANDPSAGGNPRAVDARQLQELFVQAVEGRLRS